MPDLLTTAQVNQIRDVFHDLSETFAFPVTIRRTTFAQGAFRSDPATEEFVVNAIREFDSKGEADRFRNDLGPTEAHEMNLYVHWRDFQDAGLVDGNNKVLLDHNDVVIMEGEEYEIVAFEGIAQMSKQPAFVFIKVKRQWAKAS